MEKYVLLFAPVDFRGKPEPLPCSQVLFYSATAVIRTASTNEYHRLHRCCSRCCDQLRARLAILMLCDCCFGVVCLKRSRLRTPLFLIQASTFSATKLCRSEEVPNRHLTDHRPKTDWMPNLERPSCTSRGVRIRAQSVVAASGRLHDPLSLPLPPLLSRLQRKLAVTGSFAVKPTNLRMDLGADFHMIMYFPGCVCALNVMCMCVSYVCIMCVYVLSIHYQPHLCK